MGKFKKNSAMITNQGIDMVVNKTEEPLLKLKKRAKPLKVSSHTTGYGVPTRQRRFCMH